MKPCRTSIGFCRKGLFKKGFIWGCIGVFNELNPDEKLLTEFDFPVAGGADLAIDVTETDPGKIWTELDAYFPSSDFIILVDKGYLNFVSALLPKSSVLTLAATIGDWIPGNSFTPLIDDTRPFLDEIPAILETPTTPSTVWKDWKPLSPRLVFPYW